MRQKRAKAYRKLMQLYCMSFGFRQPYQVLVDSEMCKEAVTHKVDLSNQFHTVLQGEVKPSAYPECPHRYPTIAIEVLTGYDGKKAVGRAQQPAVDIAKSFERRKCNHKEAIPGDECLQSVIGDNNKHRYVVATQSQPLRAKLRAIPATPLVHITRSVMILEPPSDATLEAKEMNEEEKLHAAAPDLALVEPSTPEIKKRKGPKGPNPLSVKKKKPLPQPPLPLQRQTPSIEPSVTAGNKRKADNMDRNDAETNPSKRKRKRRKK